MSSWKLYHPKRSYIKDKDLLWMRDVLNDTVFLARKCMCLFCLLRWPDVNRHAFLQTKKKTEISVKTSPSLKSLLNQVASSSLVGGMHFVYFCCPIQTQLVKKYCTSPLLQWLQLRRAGENCLGGGLPFLSLLCSQFPIFFFKHLTVHSQHQGRRRSGGVDFQFLLPFTTILLTVHF